MTKFILALLIVWSSFSLVASEVGDFAPSASLTNITLDGNSFVIPVNYIEEGKQFVLIDIMSIGCGPCVRSIPVLSDLIESIGETTSLRLVSIDRNVDAVKAFMNERQNYNIFPYAIDNTRVVARGFDIKYTPTMFIVNTDGIIVYKHIGTLEETDIKEIKDIVL